MRDVVKEAREWISTPWASGQSVKGAGCDCAGLVLGVGKAIGAIPSGYVPAPYDMSDRGTLEAELAQWCEPIDLDVDPLEPGDVIQLQVYTNQGYQPHTAIFTGADGTMIHVYGEKYGVTEHGFRGRWQTWAVGAWRWRS